MKPDIDNNSIDSSKINWPVRKLTIGDGYRTDKNGNQFAGERLVFQVGTPRDSKYEVTSISEDTNESTGAKSYVICVNHPAIENAEVVWKVLENVTKMVEREYDVSKEAYPDEGTEEQGNS